MVVTFLCALQEDDCRQKWVHRGHSGFGCLFGIGKVSGAWGQVQRSMGTRSFEHGDKVTGAWGQGHSSMGTRSLEHGDKALLYEILTTIRTLMICDLVLTHAQYTHKTRHRERVKGFQRNLCQFLHEIVKDFKVKSLICVRVL